METTLTVTKWTKKTRKTVEVFKGAIKRDAYGAMDVGKRLVEVMATYDTDTRAALADLYVIDLLVDNGGIDYGWSYGRGENRVVWNYLTQIA
jgi:hypothetical protein